MGDPGQVRMRMGGVEMVEDGVVRMRRRSRRVYDQDPLTIGS
jgi:hypothetical protein